MASRICRRLQLRSMKTCEENETTSVLKITNAKISFKKIMLAGLCSSVFVFSFIYEVIYWSFKDSKS